MFFSDLLNGFRRQADKPNNKRKSPKRQGKPKGKTSPKHILLPIHQNLNSKRALNEALKRVETSIQKDGASNQLLLQQADLLLRKEKFRQARLILRALTESTKDREAARLAKEILSNMDQIREELDTSRVKILARELHSISRKYKFKLVDLPDPENIPPSLDITLLVRKEARRARKNDLPKLSLELIEQTLESRHESPWLLHDKAISLSMLGKQEKALDLLNKLRQANNGEKLSISIDKNIDDIKKNAKAHTSRFKIYFAKQSIAIIKSHDLEPQFIPAIQTINSKTNLKLLTFKEARFVLEKNPQTSLELADTIIDYFPGDLAALQLKGEALAALDRNSEAIQTWRDLTQSQNEKIAKKAAELICDNLTKKTNLISSKNSPKTALSFYIRKHIENGMTPTLTHDVERILKQIKSFNADDLDDSLKQHQLQLQFNTLVIEQLENQQHKHDQLDTSRAAQQPSTISETASQAG